MGRYGKYRGRTGGGGGVGGGAEGEGAAVNGQVFQIMVDCIPSPPPHKLNGVYTLMGNQISVTNNLNNASGSSQMTMFQPQQQTYQNPLQLYQPPPPINGLTPPPQQVIGGDQPIIDARIIVVGTKASSSSTCCYFSTIIFGSVLIFPLFFMCCAWWKNMMYPKYEVKPEFYRALGRFLKKETQCRTLTLTVYDNDFDTAKARLLYEALQGSGVTTMNFKNSALSCNYNGSEADDFHGNMMAIKSLPITSTMKWGLTTL